MSDMPEKIFAEPPRLPEIEWAYWYPQDNSKYIDQTEYTRTDLTYPKAQVDALIDASRNVFGLLDCQDTANFDAVCDLNKAIADLRGEG